MSFLGDPTSYVPAYSLIAGYCGFILTFFSVISVFLWFRSRKAYSSFESQVRLAMMKHIFLTSLTVFCLFFSCWAFSLVDMKYRLIDFGDFSPVVRDLEIATIGFSLIPFVIVLTFYWISRPKLTGKECGVQANKDALVHTTLLILFLTLIPAIEALLLVVRYPLFYKALYVHGIIAGFALIYSTYTKQTSLTQLLRWLGVAILIAWISAGILRVLVVRPFVPQAMKYCNSVIQVLEEEKSKSGKYPEELPINNQKLLKPPLLIRQQLQLYFCGQDHQSFSLCIDVDSFYSYQYSSFKKKWEYCRLDMWY